MAKRSSTFDLGQQTLKMYRGLMSIDDAWLEPQERGFSWWSGPLAQRVWASPPWQDQEGDLFQLVAETDIRSVLYCTFIVARLTSARNAAHWRVVQDLSGRPTDRPSASASRRAAKSRTEMLGKSNPANGPSNSRGLLD